MVSDDVPDVAPVSLIGGAKVGCACCVISVLVTGAVLPFTYRASWSWSGLHNMLASSLISHGTLGGNIIRATCSKQSCSMQLSANGLPRFKMRSDVLPGPQHLAEPAGSTAQVRELQLRDIRSLTGSSAHIQRLLTADTRRLGAALREVCISQK